MRPLWQGSISFGLVNIPVRMFSAVQHEQIDFDYLHKGTLAPIRYARIDTETGKEVPWDEIVKGVKSESGKYTVVEEGDFEKAALDKSDTIAIEAFVEASQIDPKLFETPYYLAPDPEAERTYALLRDSLRKSGKVGIAEFVMRSRERLVVLEPVGDALILNQIRYSTELRPAEELELPGKFKFNSGEVDMALELIDRMSGEFDPDEYRDDYITSLKRLISRKRSGKKAAAEQTPAKPQATEEKELASKLEQSIRELGARS